MLSVKIVRGLAVLLLAGLLTGGALAQDKDKKDKDKPAETKKVAKLTVKVPEDDALLWIEDREMRSTGKSRDFESPPLIVGKKYVYTVKVFWEPNNYTKITRTRKIQVEAGKSFTLDLTKEDPKQPDDIQIRYVPTPEKVVEAMMKLGKVGKDDTVFDLGCGDGRIVITAVAKFKAKKGVGVDIDPERIKESVKNAKDSMVDDKVEFRKEDVMKMKDLKTATVVCLYLADELNEQLAPILKKELPNGARIISHRFLMGKWKPEKSQTIKVDGVDYQIHLWTIKKEKGKEKDKDKAKDKDKDDKKEKDKDDKKEKDK